ncbi:hypothetical protein SAMN04487771_1002107 [[Clostridium] aminophilum]|uniref:Uncharacterized protein n=2 Tax=[Clostridium] aminophilum TaxID=1526 RepID=A0A1I0APB0_9FIRM|nr:hypothetical protein SAMN04487771_1002107 [[Clostridium] aminophilum]
MFEWEVGYNMKRETTSIEKEICAKFKRTQIPEAITIDSDGAVVTITLDGKKVVEDNMQDTGNAFEGWAIVAHICSQKDVVLKVNKITSFPKDSFIGHGHFNRFIYRIMKFSEQYNWFSVDSPLEAEINRFRDFIDKNVLVNNKPTKEAEESDRIDENSIEKKLSEDGILKKVLGETPDIGTGKVYRQLPVGLFSGEKSKDTAVFTYGHSAIDLWNKDGNTINIIELKYNNNMIGIITEIFFYSNYMLDLVSNTGLFHLAENEGDNCRGYAELKKGMERVNGIMLANSYHPCIEDERCLKELNKNKLKDRLKYYCVKYDAKIIVVDITGQD